MKILLCVAFFLEVGLLTVPGQGAQADQIKRRARNLADQNNAQQGVPPGSPTAPAPTQRHLTPPATVAAPAPRLTPQQQSVASLRADLALLTATNSVETQKRFSRTLLTTARGTGKPTGAATDQLAKDVAAGLQSAKLTSTQLDRLALNFEGALNSAVMGKSQTDAIAADVKSILEKSGVNGQRASLVADDLKRITAEIQKPPGK